MEGKPHSQSGLENCRAACLSRIYVIYLRVKGGSDEVVYYLSSRQVTCVLVFQPQTSRMDGVAMRKGSYLEKRSRK